MISQILQNYVQVKKKNISITMKFWIVFAMVTFQTERKLLTCLQS